MLDISRYPKEKIHINSYDQKSENELGILVLFLILTLIISGFILFVKYILPLIFTL